MNTAFPGHRPGSTTFEQVSPEDDERYGRMFDDHRAANAYLADHAWEIGQAHPDSWVAIDEHGVVASHPTSTGLEAILKARGIPDACIVRYFFMAEDRLKKLVL